MTISDWATRQALLAWKARRMGGCGCQWPITQEMSCLARRPKPACWRSRFEQQVAQTSERLERQQQALKQAKQRLAETEQQVQEYQQQVDDLEQDYQTRKLQERPTSRLAQARKRLQAVVKRVASRTSVWMQAQRRLDKTMAQHSHQQAELAALNERLLRFEQENAANSEPVEAEFRLDAGFGTYENVALLIEMGYNLYTKPHSHKIVAYRVWAGRRHHCLDACGCYRRTAGLAHAAPHALP